MTKREKIILIIMLLTITWGWYMLFYEPEKRSPSKPSTIGGSDQDKKFIADLTTKLAQQTPSNMERHMLELARDPWTKDPFLSPAKGLHSEKKKVPARSPDQSAHAVANWVYSGYLEAAGKRLAIINGLEYEEGEGLFPLGYYIQHIEKSHIIIGVVGKKITFSLPLIEP